MMAFAYLLVVLMCLWLLYVQLRVNPSSFSLENINKSMLFLGVLAIVLLLFISFVIIALRIEA